MLDPNGSGSERWALAVKNVFFFLSSNSNMLQYYLVKKSITIKIYEKSTLSHFRMSLPYQFDDLPEVQDGFSQAFVLANLILG